MLKKSFGQNKRCKKCPLFLSRAPVQHQLAVLLHQSLLHLICDSCRYKLKHKLHLSKTASGIFHFPLKTRKKNSMIICLSLNFLLANTDQDETIDFFNLNTSFFLIDPWNSHRLFLQFPWKFHTLNSPPPCLDFSWNGQFLQLNWSIINQSIINQRNIFSVPKCTIFIRKLKIQCK